MKKLLAIIFCLFLATYAYADGVGGDGIDGASKDNVAATAAPAVTDDSGDGYSVGSDWIDVTNDVAYKCVDATVGAAVWLEIGPGATGVTTMTLTDNENTNENNPIWFSAGAAGSGSVGPEADGDLHYNPSTGTVTTTQFVGGGAGITGVVLDTEIDKIGRAHV